MPLRIDRTRYEACPLYNEWLDEVYVQGKGDLNIFGFQPRPSEVLFQMSPDTYVAAFADFQQSREDRIKEIVFDQFPSPIAHYFYRFENGYESLLQRLHLLRDTWEAIVDVAHALTVAECRHREIALGNPSKFSDLLSDRVAQRLQNVERLMQQAADAGTALEMSRIVPIETLQRMRDLNQARNGFSHSAAQSETQARTWIDECYGDVVDVLEDIKGMGGVRIYRYLGQVDGRTLRCESFVGHSFTRTIKPVALNSSQVAASQRYFQPGQLLAMCDGYLFALRPLLYYKEDAIGHVTKLCTFRRVHGDAPNRKVEYEVVGEAVRHSEDRAVMQAEIDDLRALFGLAPE